jgi:hypothetical protein
VAVLDPDAGQRSLAGWHGPQDEKDMTQ